MATTDVGVPARDTAPRLSRWTYTGYGVGSVGTGIFSTVPGLLLLTFMVRQLAVSPALAGLVILLPRLWDVVTDPLAGSLSDRTRSRLGPRRPWLLAGSVLMPVAFVGLFQVPDGLSGGAAAAWVLGLYVLGTTAFTIFQVPYVAMPAEMTDSPDERTSIVSWRIAFLTIGILVAGAAAPAVVNGAGGGRAGYSRMGWVIGAALFVALFACFLGTARTRTVAPTRAAVRFRDQFRATADNRPFRWLFAAFVLQALGVGVILAGTEFFAAYTLGDEEATTFLFVALVAPALVTMPFWSWVGHRFGKRAGFTACVAIFAVGALSLVTASPDRAWLVYLQVAVMGTAYAGTQMFPYAMLPDVIAADAAATGQQRAGAFTGIWTAGEKAGLAVGPAIYAMVLAVSGFVESEAGQSVAQSDTALTGIVVGFAVVPALLMLASLPMLRRYPATPPGTGPAHDGRPAPDTDTDSTTAPEG